VEQAQALSRIDAAHDKPAGSGPARGDPAAGLDDARGAGVWALPG
jgi:hypothetical protein